MEPMSKYYFKDGVFKLRSKWPRRIRILVSTIFFSFAALFPIVEGHTIEPNFSITKSNQVESIYSFPGITRNDANQIVHSVYKWSSEFKVDKKLLLAIAKVESTFNKYAISPSGALGIMQVIPKWHKEKVIAARDKLGNPELFNIDTNIFIGAWILKDCLIKHRDTSKALLCYSGQTEGYDQKVMHEYRKF